MRPLFYHFGLLLCLVLLALSLSPSALAQNTRSVFYWKEVTVGQKVLISQAGFYPEGFELIDTVGHKILIPFNFETHHVYTLKFAVSPDGTLYFVNQGDYPVLYLPQDGFLVNGLWTDTRWYPFTGAFHPSRPVFLSIAPATLVFSEWAGIRGCIATAVFGARTRGRPAHTSPPLRGKRSSSAARISPLGRIIASTGRRTRRIGISKPIGSRIPPPAPSFTMRTPV